MTTEHNNPQDNVTVPRELLRQIHQHLERQWKSVEPWSLDDSEVLSTALQVVLEKPVVKTEPIGEIVWDCNAYPWKRISCLHESDIAGLPIGTKVCITPQAQEKA